MNGGHENGDYRVYRERTYRGDGTASTVFYCTVYCDGEWLRELALAPGGDYTAQIRALVSERDKRYSTWHKLVYDTCEEAVRCVRERWIAKLRREKAERLERQWADEDKTPYSYGHLDTEDEV